MVPYEPTGNFTQKYKYKLIFLHAAEVANKIQCSIPLSMVAEMLQKSKFSLYVLYLCHMKFWFYYMLHIYVILFVIYLWYIYMYIICI